MIKNLYIALFCLTYSLIAAQNPDNQMLAMNTQQHDTVTIQQPCIPATNQSTNQTKVIYSMSSPLEFAGIIKNSGGSYHYSSFDTTHRAVQYNTTTSMALHLGISLMDMCYAAHHNKTQDFFSNAVLVDEIRKEFDIHIDSVHEKTAMLRSDIPKRHAMLEFIAYYYMQLSAFLQENHRHTHLFMIEYGAWIEGLYLVCNSIGDATSNKKLMNCLAERKMDAAVVMKKTQRLSSPDNTTMLRENIKNLKTVFDKVKYHKSSNTASTGQDGITVLSSRCDVTMSKAVLHEIIKKVTTIREQYITME
jgi:hypothetical protein